MPKFNLQIPYPAFIESLIVFFLLRYRKKHYGVTFRKIRLVTGRPVAPEHQFAIVDPEDFKKLSQYDWHPLERKSKCYAARFDEGIILYMHRFIMNAPKGKIVDHRNRESLDNRKANLRFATHSQNCCNKNITKNGTSKYRGVSIEKGSKNWRATIYCNRIHIPLGFFENEEDAARAYDNAAKIYHGEFAMLNFPDDPANQKLCLKRMFTPPALPAL